MWSVAFSRGLAVALGRRVGIHHELHHMRKHEYQHLKRDTQARTKRAYDQAVENLANKLSGGRVVSSQPPRRHKHKHKH